MPTLRGIVANHPFERHRHGRYSQLPVRPVLYSTDCAREQLMGIRFPERAWHAARRARQAVDVLAAA